MTVGSFGAATATATTRKWLGEKHWTPFQFSHIDLFFSQLLLHWQTFRNEHGTEVKTGAKAKLLKEKKNSVSCVTPGEMSYGRLAGGRLPPPLNPVPHHHHHSHIHGLHLSNQISWCVQSAVTFYMNYKPAYMYTLKTFPLHEPAWKRFCDFTVSCSKLGLRQEEIKCILSK